MRLDLAVLPLSLSSLRLEVAEAPVGLCSRTA